MSHPTVQRARRGRQPDWLDARDVVSRIGAAPVVDVQQLHWSPQASTAVGASNALVTVNVLTVADTVDGSPVVSVNSHDLSRSYAEIEQASATLRRLEPQLEIWLPDAVPPRDVRPPYSIWALIGGIWISTVSVVAGGIGALMYLFG